VFKGLVLCTIVQEIRGRNGSVLAEGTIAPAPHESGSIFELQWTEQHGVHYREQRGVGADAEREGEYRNYGEAGRFS
jgi:hypothetical protein